jgi:CheY-like chemotaxis protein
MTGIDLIIKDVQDSIQELSYLRAGSASSLSVHSSRVHTRSNSPIPTPAQSVTPPPPSGAAAAAAVTVSEYNHSLSLSALSSASSHSSHSSSNAHQHALVARIEHEKVLSTHLSDISSILTNIKSTNAFMLMTINRCLDYTKASNGLKLTPKYETIDLKESLMLPLRCMMNIQKKVKISLNESCFLSSLSTAVGAVGGEDTSPIKEDPLICSHIITDKQWLQENILCLLSNAVKYSSEGTVTINVSLQPRNSMKATAGGSNPRDTFTSIVSMEGGGSGGGGGSVVPIPLQQFQAAKERKEKEKRERGGGFLRFSSSSSSSSTSIASYLSEITLLPFKSFTVPKDGIKISPYSSFSTAAIAPSSPPAPSASIPSPGSPSSSFYRPSPYRKSLFSSFSTGANDVGRRSLPSIRDGDSSRTTSEGEGKQSRNQKERETPSDHNSPSHHHRSSSSSSHNDSYGRMIAEQQCYDFENYNDILLFEVIDEGIGMNEDAMNSLFSPFRQNQRLAGGTGLGLYSLAKRIETLKGTYGVRKRDDGKQGSCFYFSIPYRPDKIIAHIAKHFTLQITTTALSATAISSSLPVSPLSTAALSPMNNLNHNNKPMNPPPRVYDNRRDIRRFSLSDSLDHFTTGSIMEAIEETSTTPSLTRVGGRGERMDGNEDQKVVTPTRASASSLRSSYSSSSSTVASSSFRLKKLQILLAEDTPSIAKMTSMMLTRMGHKVTIAENGEIALNMIISRYEKQKKAVAEAMALSVDERAEEQLKEAEIQSKEKKVNDNEGLFDIVLMDLQMPVMDGLESTRRLREYERNHDLYDSNQQLVIGVTAATDEETYEEGLQIGINDFIPKPFTSELFSQKILYLLKMKHDNTLFSSYSQKI